MKLEPCPFCGSREIDPEGWMSAPYEIVASEDHDKPTVYRTGPACDSCGATAESVEKWNRRA